MTVSLPTLSWLCVEVLIGNSTQYHQGCEALIFGWVNMRQIDRLSLSSSSCLPDGWGAWAPLQGFLTLSLRCSISSVALHDSVMAGNAMLWGVCDRHCFSHMAAWSRARHLLWQRCLASILTSSCLSCKDSWMLRSKQTAASKCMARSLIASWRIDFVYRIVSAITPGQRNHLFQTWMGWMNCLEPFGHLWPSRNRRKAPTGAGKQRHW